MDINVSPNAPIGTATEHTAVSPLDSTIAEKMSAMIAQRDAGRKQTPIAEETAPGDSTEANVETPVDVVPQQPEDSITEDVVSDDSTEEVVAPEEVSTNSTADELIDFIEFANDNPNAKFKFTRNGKEVIIDAKKAAAILGQGSAIHEEARELKVQRAEFEEYQREQRLQQDGLSLAMEFTIQPKLKQAYDEILKTQGYQTTFKQQLQVVQDPADRARIEAAIEQNNRYLDQQSQLIKQLKPRVDEFKKIRSQQVSQALEHTRKQFKDKELRNSFVFNELREKLGKEWAGAKTQIVPGIDNLDLVTSDEHILGLIRDGLKYRDKPKGTQAGASIAALAGKKGSPAAVVKQKDEITQLREAANKGDRKAADNLLMARLNQIRAGRR